MIPAIQLATVGVLQSQNQFDEIVSTSWHQQRKFVYFELTNPQTNHAMKTFLVFVLLNTSCALWLFGQTAMPDGRQRKNIEALIDYYSQAREQRDTVLLKKILTDDVDQLVSTGEWRNGIASSVKGMLNSSATKPGTRTLTIEKIRFLNPETALVDCKYEIQNPDGSLRRMWSTFIVRSERRIWKISAIRNMLPTGR